MKILLEWKEVNPELGREEINPPKPVNDGGIPLLLATRYGHKGIVKILLGQEEINSDKSDELCRTQLWWVTEN